MKLFENPPGGFELESHIYPISLLGLLVICSYITAQLIESVYIYVPNLK